MTMKLLSTPDITRLWDDIKAFAVDLHNTKQAQAPTDQKADGVDTHENTNNDCHPQPSQVVSNKSLS
jgi:hAT family C-terminal dimerisation region